MYLDYKEHPQGVFVIDIEGDDLPTNIIWCMCWRNLLTGETGECTDYESIREFFTRTRGALYIGHNILHYDGPTLARLVGVRLSAANCIDTLILSTLYHPSIPDGHGLAAWGDRLGEPKGEFDDFKGGLTPEMLKYCHQDVLVTAKLFVRLIGTMRKIGFTEKSIYIQHRFMALLERQKKNGFYFDGKRAMVLYQELRALESDLEARVREVFPAERTYVATRNMYKKNGEETSIYLKDQMRYHIVYGNEENTYLAYEDVEFNLGSYKQRLEKLMSLGWEPSPLDPKTKTGGPKPFDKGDLVPSLQEFVDKNPVPEVELIAKWMSYNGRANMVNTWLESWNEDDSCIHGNLFVADTLRLRHQSPNTANIPGVRVSKDGAILRGVDGYFTYESRDLWTARPNRVLVGTDASGLELRMLAHYLNREAFTRQVLEGDPHSYNAEVAGVDRPTAKTLLYAIQYGAQAGKVASIIGGTFKEGDALRTQFLARLGLDEVMNEAQAEQKAGRIELVDGSMIICPSPHSALNYRLQGGGARVMAQGAIFLEQMIYKKGLDSLKVGDVHDEWIYDVHPDDAEEHRNLSLQALNMAGEELNMRLPIDGKSLIGPSWAHVH